MAILLLKTHSVDSDGSNNAIVVGDKDNSPPIEAIHAVSSQQLTSQIIWPSRVLLPDPMDLEPGRCRRTDGKKWRCRFPVLPDQKYCDRHIHRGRNRSRKPVEIRETFSTSNSTKTSRISSPKAVPSLQSTTKVRIKNQSFKIKKRSRENVCVLQDSNARGGGTSRIDHGTLAGAESQRCRRTDGKKWRCKKNVVPEQKYCRKHMHRGAKKVENENLRGQNMKNRLSFSVGMSYRRMGDEAVKPAPSLCSRT